MNSGKRQENHGNDLRMKPDILEKGRVISYNVNEDQRPGGIKVRFKIRIATGKRATEIDARQATAIMEVLQWHSQHPQHP
jgi:hypothetical protein